MLENREDRLDLMNGYADQDHVLIRKGLRAMFDSLRKATGAETPRSIMTSPLILRSIIG